LLLCSSYLPLGVPNWVVILPASGPRQPFFSSGRRKMAQSRPRFLIFPRIWAFIHPVSPGHPWSPVARSWTPDERKAGTDPLCRRENTQTLQSGRKSPSPSPRCSVAAGTTPRQSAGRLAELRRPSSHQPIFRRPACRLAIFRRRATPPVAPRRHAQQVFVHLPGRT
jgi:hypothetical protein